MAIFRGTGGQGDSTTDTTVSIVTQKAAEADASATAAASSATQAANSAASINANIVNDTTPQLGGELDGQTNKITNIGDPTSAQDAATKTYVDSQVQSKDALSELSGDSDDITEGSTNLFLTTTERTKLSGIEASATADQTAAEIRTLVESASDSNVFTDADHSKLDGIEASATADQTDAEIKTAYENNSDTNAFTDAEKTKLSGIETGATADQTASEILTAIKTVDGSGSGLDADLLDGNQASAFATSAQGSTADSALQNVSEDTTPQLGGSLSTNGNDIVFGNSDQARFGTGGGQGSLVISATATESTIAEAGSGDLTVKADTFKVTNANGLEDMLIATPDAGVALYHNDVKKLETTSSGATVTGALSTTGGVSATGDLLTFGNVQVLGTVDGRDVAADGATLDAVASTYVDVSGDTLTGDLAFGDNVKAKFGASDDLQIYHDGLNSYIHESGTGSLFIQAYAGLVVRNPIATEKILEGYVGGAVSLYYDNSKKFETTSSGVDVTGTLVSDGLTVDGDGTFQNNSGSVLLKLEGSTYPEIRMLEGDTTDVNSRITNNGGQLTFQTLAEGGTTTNRLQINHSTGDVKFYEDTGTTAKLTWDASAEELQFKDNVKAEFGDSGDLIIYHNGTNTFFSNSQGHVYLTNNSNDKDIKILTDDGSGGTTEYIVADGSTGEVNLYHYGSQKLATKSTGIDVTGTVTADGATIDGTLNVTSNALNLNASSPAFTITDSDTSAYHVFSGASSFGSLFLTVDAGNSGLGGGFYIQRNANTPAVVIANSTGDISFYDDAGSSQDLYWDASTSRLGLGTTSPQEELDISSTNPAVRLSDTTTSGLYHRVVSSSNNLYLESDAGNVAASSFIGFRTDGVEHMRLTSDRRLGIGTTSPSFKLDVQSGTDDFGARFQSSDSTSYVSFQDNSTTNSISVFCGASGDHFIANGKQKIRFLVDLSEAMLIDSSGNVGIGTTSPATELETEGTIRATTGSEYTELKYYGVEFNRLASYVRPDNNNTKYLFIGSNATYRNWLRIEHGASESHRFHIGASEAMRIDSSGNLLVGKTSPSISTAGGEIRSSGIMAATVSNGTPLYLSRLSTDGEIAQFRKDGSTVGSIGIVSGTGDNLYITGDSTHGGLQFGTDLVTAAKNGAPSDATVDLGNGNYRWRNLYLSGGVYLGGTGSANLLDDYEEGTFTPTFGGSTTDPSGVTYDSQVGQYTKVGRIVHVAIKLGTDAITSIGSGNLRIRGLPFNAAYALGVGNPIAYNFTFAINTYQMLLGSNYFDLYSSGYVSTNALDTGANKNRLWVTFSYQTS